jgi:hypothetical protein
MDENQKENLDKISTLAQGGDEYVPPAMVRVSGGDESDMGGAIAIGAAAVWVIGIGPAWIWT